MHACQLISMVCGSWVRISLLLGFLIGTFSRNTFTFTIPVENQTAKGSDPDPLIIERLGDVYEYVSSALDWWQADRYCRQRFAQLPSETWASLGQKLDSHQIQGAIWLSNEEVYLQKPRHRRE
ncbi:hypothetical protein JD844_005039 [Phrynosoma platyrhinos]|uniref:C-type lectin domain-containing protein n=1 Tax=Phrynosoma platyrhinos TaxID=52577 RepID=A0ABQ7SE26_PHRPL|nr:hypothetical protein JD844_005039 [Phrynosoma platyrhinos]